MKRLILSVLLGLPLATGGCAVASDGEGSADLSSDSTENAQAQAQALGSAVRIVAEAGGACINGLFTQNTPFTITTLKACNSSFDQSWRLSNVGTDPLTHARIFQIVQNRGVGQVNCLEVLTDAKFKPVEGAFVAEKPCVAGLRTQEWQIRGNNGGLQFTRLLNDFTKQCLVPSGANAVAHACSPTSIRPDELWDVNAF